MSHALWLLVLLLVMISAAQAGDTAAPVEEPITDADRDHWAFRPLARPTPPAVDDSAWPLNSIDRFVLARLEQKQLAPLPPADRMTLLRRASFDLTGLPPTPGEIASFQTDESPQAYEHLIDRLLASPAYGERWGQHWLDLARFAETDGFEHDKLRPDAWRYRDWVIDALNRDLPIDEFIALQIAGDELRPGDVQAAVATGFLLAGPDMPDLNLQDERRHNVLNEITATVGSVFLGLQIGCAQCHDHKYDPVSQADFYRLRAVFETAELFETSSAGRVVSESGMAPVSHLMVRGDFRRPGPVVEPAFPRIANPWGDAISHSSTGPSSADRRAALARWLTRPDHPLTTRVLMNWLWQQHFGEGLSRTPADFGVMGDSPSHPELLDWLATELIARGWSMKQIHRLLLTSATYRQASRADSTEWDGSQTRDARSRLQRSLAADPDNLWLGRMNRRRLEGEAIRDAMLAAACQLSAGRGGPGVMAPLPPDVQSALLAGQWKTDTNEERHHRRSVYLFVRRNLRYPLLEAFDRPDTQTSCPKRRASTTAPQALALMNSEPAFSAAQSLAHHAMSEAGFDETGQIGSVYLHTLGRHPTAGEIEASRRFLQSQAARLRAVPQHISENSTPDKTDPRATAALVDFCRAMLNLNEFVYVD